MYCVFNLDVFWKLSPRSHNYWRPCVWTFVIKILYFDADWFIVCYRIPSQGCDVSLWKKWISPQLWCLDIFHPWQEISENWCSASSERSRCEQYTCLFPRVGSDQLLCFLFLHKRLDYFAFFAAHNVLIELSWALFYGTALRLSPKKCRKMGTVVHPSISIVVCLVLPASSCQSQ